MSQFTKLDHNLGGWPAPLVVKGMLIAYGCVCVDVVCMCMCVCQIFPFDTEFLTREGDNKAVKGIRGCL